jgi:electron transfer flavoprotein beta subunit
MDDRVMGVANGVVSGLEASEFSVFAGECFDHLNPTDGLGEALNKVVSVAMLPLYTSYLTPADYGVDIAPRLSVVKVNEPKKRESGEKVADVDALIAKLKNIGAI